MLLRLAVAAGSVLLAFAVYRAWKHPPRLTRVSLVDLGVSGPAIVQFSTRTCAPCRTARPVLIEAAREARVGYAQIELDDRPEVAGRYRIRTVPTIVVAGPSGEVLGVWTSLPAGGVIADVARKARAA
jgi:thiol-disulfide isomerase/thioredoxin